MTHTLPTLHDIPDLKGKTVLLRTMFNVPVHNGAIVDDFRIRKSLPSIQYLRDAGARVVLLSHIWGGEERSLRVVHEYLSKLINVSFVEECIGTAASEAVSRMSDGDVVMFENIRLHEGEVSNDADFIEGLAGLADIYVNDAFPVGHREHASVVGIPKHLPSYAGLRFVEEVEALSRVFDPEHPFLFVIGGAKFNTKLPLLRKFVVLADTVYVAGALVKPILAARGVNVSGGQIPDDIEDVNDLAGNDSLTVPEDFVCWDEDIPAHTLRSELCVEGEGMIVDVGEASVEQLREMVQNASLVVWNGPLGWYEKGFSAGSTVFAEIVSESNTTSIIGGGDTLAVLEKAGFDYEDAFSFVSTGGGAMLQFLTDETLPAITAIMNSPAPAE